MTRRVVRTIVALMLIGLIRGGYGLVMAWRQDPFSTEALRAASDEVNRQLPAYIGTELQLVHTSANDGRLVSELRLVNDTGAVPSLVTAASRATMRQTACSNDKSRELLRHHIRLLYHLTTSDKRPIAVIEIAPSDCGL